VLLFRKSVKSQKAVMKLSKEHEEQEVLWCEKEVITPKVKPTEIQEFVCYSARDLSLNYKKALVFVPTH
jgi:hypothetical protein